MKIDPKSKLADAFIELASRDGAYRITLEAVAKKAKIPFSTAHYHLKATKLSLVEFGLREVSARGQAFTVEFLERAARAHPEANPLHQYIEVTHAWARKQRSLATLWLFHYHLASVDARARADYQPFLDAAVSRIEKLIYECIGRGLYPERAAGSAGLSTPDLALAIHSLLIGSLHRGLICVSEGDEAMKEHEEVSRKAVDALLGGEKVARKPK